MRHEAIAGSNAPDGASAMVSFIENPPVGINEIIFWMDNCSAQNNNWCLFLAMLVVQNEEVGPNTVIFEYLERGRTCMRADAIHGCTGKKLKKQSVFTFDHLLGSIESCSRKIKCLPLAIENFSHWGLSSRARCRSYPNQSHASCSVPEGKECPFLQTFYRCPCISNNSPSCSHCRPNLWSKNRGTRDKRYEETSNMSESTSKW